MITETLNLEKLILVNQDGTRMAVNKRDTKPALYPQDRVINYNNILYVQEGKEYRYFARVKNRKGEDNK